MKIMFMKWESFGNPYIIKEFTNAGYEIIEYDFPQKTKNVRANEELSGDIVKKILENGVSLVFSFNYFPVIAMAAKACRRKYFCWVYDSPAILLYSKTIFFDANYIFHFDHTQVVEFQNAGVEHIYYLPMAAAVQEYDELVVKEQDRLQYHADVAMIGSMYDEERYQIFKRFDGFDDYTKGYLDAVVNAQAELYGTSILEEALQPDIMQRIAEVFRITTHVDGWERPEWVIANYYLAKKATAKARRELMELLSREFDVALYTPEATAHLTRVRNMGCVDYYKEAPLAMKCAKININNTLRSIPSGIPLRAMDIMGCGGFLLTNYQADFPELFQPGEDFVYYESAKDAVQLVHYYLQHEEERKHIAETGYQKVKQFHTFRQRVQTMLSVVLEG